MWDPVRHSRSTRLGQPPRVSRLARRAGHVPRGGVGAPPTGGVRLLLRDRSRGQPRLDQIELRADLSGACRVVVGVVFRTRSRACDAPPCASPTACPAPRALRAGAETRAFATIEAACGGATHSACTRSAVEIDPGGQSGRAGGPHRRVSLHARRSPLARARDDDTPQPSRRRMRVAGLEAPAAACLRYQADVAALLCLLEHLSDPLRLQGLERRPVGQVEADDGSACAPAVEARQRVESLLPRGIPDPQIAWTPVRLNLFHREGGADGLRREGGAATRYARAPRHAQIASLGGWRRRRVLHARRRAAAAAALTGHENAPRWSRRTCCTGSGTPGRSSPHRAGLRRQRHRGRAAP